MHRAPNHQTRNGSPGRPAVGGQSIPRIPPVQDGDWTAAQRDYLQPYAESGMLFNVFRTAAHHPELGKAWDAFAFGHVNGGTSTLSPRHRELLLLRTGWLCRSEYEWAIHSRIAKSIGMTDDELRWIIEGPDAPGWTPFEATLLRAADELHDTSSISDATWQALGAEYSTRQLIDLVFAVGTYTLASMALNSFGVKLDDGLTGFPEQSE